METLKNTEKKIVIGYIIHLCVVILIVALMCYFYGPLLLVDGDENNGTYTQAAVATDAEQCSKIGVNILKKNGSAVDAAIASLLCVGVINFHSAGIGGGGFMVYYNATSKKASVIDYREIAPMKANSDLYNPYDTVRKPSVDGSLAIAVPGELRGFELAHSKYGRLDWEELFEPAAKQAEEGFEISSTLGKAIRERINDILNGSYKGMNYLLRNFRGELLEEGDTITRKLYARTLRAIGASGNANYFYEGLFMKNMVKELKEAGAIIEEADFLNYKALIHNPIESTFDGLRVIGTPPPSGGAVLALILNILKGDMLTEPNATVYHRIVESFKFAYGQRLRLGDPDPAFNDDIDKVLEDILSESEAEMMRQRITDNTHEKDYYLDEQVLKNLLDDGTTHVCVLAPNGDAVAATNSINLRFGSLVRSLTSGVIFNDEMNDFSIPSRNDPNILPATKPNYIQPGKRPQSSSTPTILLDGGEVKMVVGASGGTKIPTATALVILNHLRFKMHLSSAISHPRLHNQLYPDYTMVEADTTYQFQKDILDALEEKGHMIKKGEFSVVQGIVRSEMSIQATSDPRKGGKPAGF